MCEFQKNRSSNKQSSNNFQTTPFKGTESVKNRHNIQIDFIAQYESTRLQLQFANMNLQMLWKENIYYI